MGKKILIIFGLVILILFGAIVWGYFNASKINPGPKISVDPASIDFGSVKIDQPVSREVLVRNLGQGVLKINGVATSCGCTTAKIDQNEINPGAGTKLTVTYDPRVHKETGAILRMVYLESNDSETPEKEIEVRAKVIK